MSHLIFCFKTNRPGAWRIGGWGLRRRTRNGEYQVRGFLAPDIPNHCRQLKSFSKSSTGRETLRSGWSAVRNRSSCFPFAWLVMVVFPGGRFSQRTSFCLARCTGRLWCHPRQASRRDAACRARRAAGQPVHSGVLLQSGAEFQRFRHGRERFLEHLGGDADGLQEGKTAHHAERQRDDQHGVDKQAGPVGLLFFCGRPRTRCLLSG